MTKRSMTLFLVIALAVVPVTWAAVNVKAVSQPEPTTKLRLCMRICFNSRLTQFSPQSKMANIA